MDRWYRWTERSDALIDVMDVLEDEKLALLA